MATAPISRKLNLTRDQLAAFLTDQQQIRQFELLFSTVDTLQVIVGTDFEFQADNAAATANEALAQINALAQVVDLNGQAEALSYLAEISKQIQALESAPPFSAPPAVTPASPTTSVQFNNGGAFGGSANFTFDVTNRILNVGPAALTTTIETLAPTGAALTAPLRLRGKNASATNGNGGPLFFTTGNALGTGSGGQFLFTGGTGASGGAFNVTCGAGTTSGGQIQFSAGSVGTTGNGGDINFFAGGASLGGTGIGGFVRFRGGSSGGNGGGFEMEGGSSNTGNGGGATINGGFTSSGTGGSFALIGGSSSAGVGGNATMQVLFGGAGSGSIFLKTNSGSVVEITETLAAVKQLGFFGATPVAKPTVTGSRATGAALQDLLTQLAALGLITNSTTA